MAYKTTDKNTVQERKKPNFIWNSNVNVAKWELCKMLRFTKPPLWCLTKRMLRNSHLHVFGVQRTLLHSQLFLTSNLYGEKKTKKDIKTRSQFKKDEII